MGAKHTKQNSTELTDKRFVVEIALLKANTKYDERAIREWHAGFIRDCPMGRLDKKKFAEVYQQFYPTGKVDKYCKYAFDTFDANDDGSITFDEFLLALAAANQGNVDDRLEVAFDLYDVSDDGQIDQKELATLISAMYDLVGETDRKGDRDPKKRAAEMLSKLDASGDRKISKAEFIAGCKSDPIIRQVLAPNA